MPVTGPETGGTGPGLPSSLISTTQPPTSQKDQHVIFYLNSAVGGGQQSTETLVVELNPEETTFQYPSRVTTVNTIAGAYQDNWGPGIGKFQMAGTTGWRRFNTGLDGFQRFVAMREFHKKYQRLCAENDPSDVSLIVLVPPGDYTNNLLSATGANPGDPHPNSQNQFAYSQVSADNFQGSRSKAQPLLFRYQWEFTVLRDLLDGKSVDPSARFVVNGSGSVPDPLAPGGGGGGSGSGGTGTEPGGTGTGTPPKPPGVPEDQVQKVTGDGHITLTDILKQNTAEKMTLPDLMAYNQAVWHINLNDITHNGLFAGIIPPGFVVYVPPTTWLIWYHAFLQGGIPAH